MSEHGERALWAAVMELAWQDATGLAATSDREPAWRIKAQARRWFENGEGTFPTCGQALGLDETAVRDRYRAAIEADVSLARVAAKRAAEIAAKPVNPYRRVLRIVEDIAAATGLSETAILSKRILRGPATEARQLAMWIAHQEGISLGDIGAAMDRDHSTVWHGVRREAERQEGTADAQVEEDGYVAAQGAERPVNGQHRRAQA